MCGRVCLSVEFVADSGIWSGGQRGGHTWKQFAVELLGAETHLAGPSHTSTAVRVILRNTNRADIGVRVSFQPVYVHVNTDTLIIMGLDLVVDWGWLSYDSVWSMIVVGHHL